MNDKRVSAGDSVAIVVIALLFTGVQVAYSLRFGRLAIPPVYDDIGYLREGFALLKSGYEHGWSRWVIDAFAKTWHAPIAVLQACLGLALTAGALWGPYVLNGLYLGLLLLVLRGECRLMHRTLFFALVIALIGWPLTGFLIAEFRPDIATGLFITLGGWRLARNQSAIASGSLRTFPSLWSISWPFILAMWLKPSYLPVTVGYWGAAWTIIAVVSVLRAPGQNGLRNTIRAFAQACVLLLVCFLPYLAIGWRHLGEYWQSNVFGANREIWSPSLSILDDLQYYVVGEGGRATMRWWAPVTVGTALVAAFAAFRRKDQQAFLLGGLFLAFTVVAWAGLTLLGNKSPWFGSLVSSHFLCLFVMSITYLGSLALADRGVYVLAAFLVAGGVSLQRWPIDGALPNMAIADIPAYASEARRVHADVCKALREETHGQRTTVLVPVISLLVNPDLAELCEVEYGDSLLFAPQIYTLPYADAMKAVREFAQSADPNVLALVLSENFRSIPGNLPTSKHAGTINQYFESSRNFSLVATIDGPQKSGQVRIFRKTGEFPVMHDVRGIRNPEGPYPQLSLPVVRWALFPGAAFDVAVVPQHRFSLSLVGRSAKPAVAAVIRLSSGESKRCGFVAERFSECRLDFVAGGENVRVALEFEKPGVPGGPEVSSPDGSEAVLLSRVELTDLDGRSATATRDAGRAGIAFRNIDFVQGFGDVEGPYPQWQLPVVVWGRGTESHFTIAGGGAAPDKLVLEWRPEDGVSAIIVVSGGKTIGRCAADVPRSGFRRCEIALPPEGAASAMTLQYERTGGATISSSTNSVLFKHIGLTRNDR